MRELDVTSGQGDGPLEDAGETRIFDQGATTRPAAPADVGEGSGARVGEKVSRYVILEEVGKGAMGRVLRAYDPRLQREVAIKELRTEAMSAEATSRLVNEARAMAAVSHPNVVPVFDVEPLGGGQIILVMQYVAGTTMRAWMRTEPPWREVVDTLVAAGYGLDAAHRAGLLHRDFKPANVLLAQDGAVKVTDFGLAKPAGRRERSISASGAGSGDDHLSSDPVVSTSQTRTEVGVVLGTPRYMAPEQHFGAQLTPSADQYAFCVSLWEALVHAPPFSGHGLGKKKRGGPPPWPGEGVPRFVVDAVMRGLSPHPEDRWPSMQALLERLANDPAKRRNKRLTVAGVVTLAMTSAGFAWQAYSGDMVGACAGAAEEVEEAWGEVRRRETKAALLEEDTPYARATWERASLRLDEFTDAWIAEHEDACRATAVRGVQSESVLDLRMACLRSVELDLRAVTGVLANADADVRNNVDTLLASLPRVERCADVERLQADVEPPPKSLAAPVHEARSLLATADAERNAGRFEGALSRTEDAAAALAGVDYPPVSAELHLAEGKVHDRLGRYEEAMVALRLASHIAASTGQRALLRDATTRSMHVLGKRMSRFSEALALAPVAEGLAKGHPLEEADVANVLALIFLEKGDVAEAEVRQRRAFELRRAALGDGHPGLGASHHSLALVFSAQSRYAEELEQHRKSLDIWMTALGPEHPNVSMAMSNIATSYFLQGLYEESEAAHRESLELRIAALGPDHPEVLDARVNFALTLCKQGQWKTCDAELTRALDVQKSKLGPDDRALSRTYINLAVARQAQGKVEEAARYNQLGLEIAEKTLGPDHHDTAVVRINIANGLAARGDHAKAADAYRKAIGTLVKTTGPEHASVAIARNNLAAMLEELGRIEEAESQYRQALEIRLATIGEDHPKVATVRTALARVLLQREAAEEALLLAEKGWARVKDADAPTRGEAAFVLARALLETGHDSERRARARELAETAKTAYAEVEATPDLKKLEAWRRAQRRWLR